MHDHARAPTAVLLTETRTEVLEHIKTVRSTGDLDLILSAERAFLENDLIRHANSKAMTGSLQTALDELAAAEKLVVKVRDPGTYRFVDEAHSLPKNRIGGVPRDEARQFFSSHAARLLNQDKSRLDPEEKKIVEARKTNMRTGAQVYTTLQHQALGLTDDKAKGKGRDSGPAL